MTNRVTLFELYEGLESAIRKYPECKDYQVKAIDDIGLNFHTPSFTNKAKIDKKNKTVYLEVTIF